MGGSVTTASTGPSVGRMSRQSPKVERAVADGFQNGSLRSQDRASCTGFGSRLRNSRGWRWASSMRRQASK